MRMSTKGRFAVNAMIDLALRERSGPVALAAISSRQQVSLSYLEQLFAHLRQQGMVQSTRGPDGGYTLARPAAEISVADIVCAVDDQVDRAEASGISRELWQRLNAVLREHMSGIMLASLVDEQLAKGMQVEPKAPRRSAPPSPPPKPQRLVSRPPNSVFAFGQGFNR